MMDISFGSICSCTKVSVIINVGHTWAQCFHAKDQRRNQSSEISTACRAEILLLAPNKMDNGQKPRRGGAWSGLAPQDRELKDNSFSHEYQRLNIELLRHMLHREFVDEEMRSLSRKFTEWVYGPVHSSLYDTSSIDTNQDHSVLEKVVFRSEIPFPAGTAPPDAHTFVLLYVGLLVTSLALASINVLYYSRGSKQMGMYSAMMEGLLLPS